MTKKRKQPRKTARKAVLKRPRQSRIFVIRRENGGDRWGPEVDDYEISRLGANFAEFMPCAIGFESLTGLRLKRGEIVRARIVVV